ncbi:MAG: MarR family winged helix-turn-helix transcriptional regulator [Betaproteobacteria bacterium]
MTTANTQSTAVGYPCVCGRLRRAARALTQLYDDTMSETGLRVTQFSLLRTLERGGSLRISALAASMLLDRTALSRNLEPLVAEGLVAIVAGRDARTRQVSLTRAGRARLAAAVPYWERAQVEVSRHLGSPKVANLVGLLKDVEALHPQSGTAN